MTMNDDIKKYPVFGLCQEGLVKIELESTDDYNHFTHHLHHYIKQQSYKGNKQWFDDRGIEQKLILMPVNVHLQVHLIANKNLTDAEFKKKYHIGRWELLFNRHHTSY